MTGARLLGFITAYLIYRQKPGLNIAHRPVTTSTKLHQAHAQYFTKTFVVNCLTLFILDCGGSNPGRVELMTSKIDTCHYLARASALLW